MGVNSNLRVVSEDDRVTLKEWSKYQAVCSDVRRGMYLTVKEQEFLVALVGRLAKQTNVSFLRKGTDDHGTHAEKKGPLQYVTLIGLGKKE